MYVSIHVLLSADIKGLMCIAVCFGLRKDRDFFVFISFNGLNNSGPVFYVFPSYALMSCILSKSQYKEGNKVVRHSCHVYCPFHQIPNH